MPLSSEQILPRAQMCFPDWKTAADIVVLKQYLKIKEALVLYSCSAQNLA